MTAMLEGASNFRDIGGLLAGDGRTVRTGAVFRSGHLSGVTAGDRVILDDLGIAAVFDLRTRIERERDPTQWSSPAMATHIFKAGHKRRLIDMALEFPPTRSGALALMQQFYDEMPLTMGHAFGEMIQRMSTGAIPCMIHCSAGKDRTGVAIAVLLATLGVARSDIIADYAKSAAVPRIKEDMARALATARVAETSLDHYPPEFIATAMNASPDYLEHALAAIDDRFGSVTTYLDAQGVSEKAISDLRAILLVDDPRPCDPLQPFLSERSS